MKCRGFTEEKFRKEYGEFEWLMSVCRFIEQGKEKNAAGRETLAGRIAFRKKRRHGNGGLAEREKRNKYKIAAK